MSKKYTENDNQRQANLLQHLSENNFFHYTVMIQKNILTVFKARWQNSYSDLMQNTEKPSNNRKQ